MDGGEVILIARIMAGDEEALAEVFDRYGGLVYGLARRVTGNPTVAEDVAQEVFTTLWSHPDHFDPGRGSLRAFLGVQAHRRAVDTVRQDLRRTARDQRLQEMAPVTAAVDDETDTAELLQIVRRAIGRLPAGQREAVELAYFGGYTQREVARVLGIPEGTAKSRLRLAYAKLSQWLAPEIMVHL